MNTPFDDFETQVQCEEVFEAMPHFNPEPDETPLGEYLQEPFLTEENYFPL